MTAAEAIASYSDAYRTGIAALAVWSSVIAPAAAATLLPGFTEGLVATGLTNPTAMEFAPDGRLFVALQGGQVRVVKDGSLLPTPFLTLTVNSTGERGLLGVAFDPAFNTNQHVYVYYTATSPGIHNRVSRFTANGDVAVPGSEAVLIDLNVETLSGATNHNGGAIHFGQDGKLYVAVGDNNVPSNAQDLANRLGKVLRDLGHGPAQSVHLRRAACLGTDLHQRRRAKRLGRD